MSVDLLPVLAQPRENESLYGILSRTATLNQVPLSRLMARTKLGTLTNPSDRTLRRSAQLTGLPHDALRRRTAAKYLASGAPASWLHVGPVRTCPGCKVHRPEYYFLFVFSCPECHLLLSVTPTENVPVSARLLGIQTDLLRGLEPLTDIKFLDSVFVATKTRALAAKKNRNRDSPDGSEEAGNGVGMKGDHWSWRSIPPAQMAAALTYVYDHSDTIRRRKRNRVLFESVSWGAYREAGARALDGTTLEELLTQLDLTSANVPMFFPSSCELTVMTTEQRQAWVALSLLLGIAVAGGPLRARWKETVSSFRFREENAESRIAADLSQSDPEIRPLIAWAALQAHALGRDMADLRARGYPIIERLVRRLRPHASVTDLNQLVRSTAVDLLFVDDRIHELAPEYEPLLRLDELAVIEHELHTELNGATRLPEKETGVRTTPGFRTSQLTSPGS